MIRHSSRILLLPRGRFSSMLDLGGSPGAKVDTRVDVGKNNKVQACLLDFDLITRSIAAQKAKAEAETRLTSSPKKSSFGGSSAAADIEIPSDTRPDVGMVEKFAGLLRVQLGGQIGGKQQDGGGDDDLSLLTGERSKRSFAAELPSFGHSAEMGDVSKANAGFSSAGMANIPNRKKIGADGDDSDSSISAPKGLPLTDIRERYAKKLRSKLDGGLAGIDLARYQRDEALKKGDAAGNAVARRVAEANPPSESGSRWLAATGSGDLLMCLSGRSMKVALLPVPGGDGDAADKEGRTMEELTAQLPQARIDVLARGGPGQSCDGILKSVSEELNVPPLGTLLVSDRDDYLRSAKEMGMFTCRVRPKNAPRGNITASHSVSTVAEVQDVINELNGISFNAVFGGKGIDYGGV